jgi:DNA-binding transcriptional MerR regulator
MLTPGQIATALNVSPATVRRWSARFARHLSPQTPNRKRTYTPDDLAVLARVRDLSATGSPLDQVDQALSLSAQTADASTALITLADFAQSLQVARASVAGMQSQIDKQTAQIKAIADWFALPFYKRLFAKPPRLDL